MLSSLSNCLADYLQDNKIINEKEKEIYVYGFEIIISSIIGVLLVGGLGLILNRFLESVIFLVVFISTREYAGGYHAKTFLSCSFIFITLYLLLLLFTEISHKNFEFYQIISILSISILTILKFAPIKNCNKKLSQSVIVTNRKKSIVISAFWAILAVVIFPWEKKLSIVITLTLGIISMLMLIEKLRKEDKYE